MTMIRARRRAGSSLGMAAAVAMTVIALAGCGRGQGHVVFHAEGNPATLSEWQVVLARDGRLELSDRVVPYDLNTPLYTDDAHKLRTIYIPPGSSARYSSSEAFDFPVGTVISKTFYYPRPDAKQSPAAVRRTDDHAQDFADESLDLKAVRLIETRLLVRRAAGWIALPYVWNAAQSDAVLSRAGDSMPLQLVADDGSREDFTYVVPNSNQCRGCHTPNNTTRVLQPLGLAARHMNRDHEYASGPENQLVHLQKIGYLSDAPAAAQWPRNANWLDTNAPLEARARAYLDINCGHCHNARGPADTSGLWLDAATTDAMRLGLCKPPVAAGQGTGDFGFGIVPGQPERSILVYRMNSTDPGAMMPEVGRSTRHAAGVALISAWIRAWPGQCDLKTG